MLVLQFGTSFIEFPDVEIGKQKVTLICGVHTVSGSTCITFTSCRLYTFIGLETRRLLPTEYIKANFSTKKKKKKMNILKRHTSSVHELEMQLYKTILSHSYEK